MGPMAVGATGCPRRSKGMTDPMNAAGVFLGGLVVTRSAIHRLGGDFVIGMLWADVRVAARTGVGCVDRAREELFVDEDRHLLAIGAGLGESLVRVTIQ